MKIKKTLTSNNIIKKVKRQVIDWKKIFENDNIQESISIQNVIYTRTSAYIFLIQ